VAHVLGDRRDHFESLKDVWQMFEIILAERKRREIDPTVEMLRASLDEARKDDDYTAGRIQAMLDFLDTMLGFYQDWQRLPKGALPTLTRLRSRVRKFLVTEGGKAK
jgi:DNA-binding transcriptional regulator GbsR (MarR family)